MKRFLIAILFVWSLLILAGCHKEASSISAPIYNQPTITEPVQDNTPVVTPEPVEEPTPVEPTPTVEVEWQTITYTWEDASGYKFEATVKVSPWINTKNETYLNSAWDKVGRSHSLPTANSKSWGNAASSDGNYRPVENATDIYYCIGNIAVKNLTTGWDITEASPIESIPIWFSACQPETNPADVKEHPSKATNYTKSSTIAKVFYRNSEERNPTWAVINPKYNSNNWGPVAFVFAHFDSKNPANPDGQYISEITDTYFCINGYGPWIWETEMSELTTAKLNVME